MLIPNKSKLAQLFCKHNFMEFEKPIDKKTNPYGFVSLNGPETIRVCVKCGKRKR